MEWLKRIAKPGKSVLRKVKIDPKKKEAEPVGQPTGDPQEKRNPQGPVFTPIPQTGVGGAPVQKSPDVGKYRVNGPGGAAGNVDVGKLSNEKKIDFIIDNFWDDTNRFNHALSTIRVPLVNVFSEQQLNSFLDSLKGSQEIKYKQAEKILDAIKAIKDERLRNFLLLFADIDMDAVEKKMKAVRPDGQPVYPELSEWMKSGVYDRQAAYQHLVERKVGRLVNKLLQLKTGKVSPRFQSEQVLTPELIARLSTETEEAPKKIIALTKDAYEYDKFYKEHTNKVASKVAEVQASGDQEFALKVKEQYDMTTEEWMKAYGYALQAPISAALKLGAKKDLYVNVAKSVTVVLKAKAELSLIDFANRDSSTVGSLASQAFTEIYEPLRDASMLMQPNKQLGIKVEQAFDVYLTKVKSTRGGKKTSSLWLRKAADEVSLDTDIKNIFDAVDAAIAGTNEIAALIDGSTNALNNTINALVKLYKFAQESKETAQPAQAPTAVPALAASLKKDKNKK